MRSTSAGLCLALVFALVLGIQAPSSAATFPVSARDNFFSPAELHIDPGDTVEWTNSGGRVHTVTSSEIGAFDSGDMGRGGTFSETFDKAGIYQYFCRYHGSRGGTGMAGTIVVGNPPPPDEGGKDDRPRLVVPKDYKTIQKAVDEAQPGSTIRIRPGVYREAVTVSTPRLVIKGTDRFRTVLKGGDDLADGFLIEGVNNVTISNMTIRNYRNSGVTFRDADHYKATKIDAIKNRTFGIHAVNSYDGVFRRSFAWGSGDSGFYIGRCSACGALVDDVHGEMNYLGYSGTDATGVTIRDSTFVRNGVGVVPNTLPTGQDAPSRGTFIYRNIVRNNNYTSVPAAGISETTGIPFGTGIWLAGVRNVTVMDNSVSEHLRYGVLISRSISSDDPSENNQTLDNVIRDSGRFDLAWDGYGMDDCFTGNDIDGRTGPEDIQTRYSCGNRPFIGTPYPPVRSDVEASIATTDREQSEPPNPVRPRCQRGAPGCDR